MLVKDGLHALYRRTSTETAYLTLLVVIGVLTFMLIALGAVLLRQKRKFLAHSQLPDPEHARGDDKISSNVELKRTPWSKKPHNIPERRSSKAFTNRNSWFNPISSVPPAYHGNVDHDDSDVLERRVGLVRASLLRNVKSVRTLAAMQTSGSVRSASKTEPHSQKQRSHESMSRASANGSTRQTARETKTEDFLSAYERESPYDWQERQEAAREDLEVYLRYQEQYPSSPERSAQGSVNAQPGLGIQGNFI